MDTTFKTQREVFETKINKNDILQINISTPDANTTNLLNVLGSASGCLVDESGMIVVPLIGPLKAEGLTKHQLADLITKTILSNKLAVTPFVTVRIINYKITILGEVGHPGVIAVPNEKITLPEALADAGDLTLYGRRDNILLIREVGDKTVAKRFSLSKEQIFNKDIYNLQNQDIIYVEPNNTRAATTDRITQLLPTVLSVASFVLVIYLELIRKY